MELARYKSHFKKHFQLAYPVVLSQLAHIMVGVADNMMVGQLGAEYLAAASLTVSVFSVVLMFGIGISYAITPLVASADGEGDKNAVAGLLKHGTVLNMIIGLLLFILGVGGSSVLYYLDQPEEVVRLAIPYLEIVAASLLPFFFFQSFRQFAEGLSFTRQAMIVSVAANVLNIILNYILIYGKLGFPAMGLNGAGYATLISRVLMAIAMAYYVYKSKHFAVYLPLMKEKVFEKVVFRKLLRIGLPTGLQYIFEVSAFSGAAIMAGWIGTNALAAHQAAINLASVSYMMATGISAAATIRVGNQLGRNDIPELRKAGFTAFGMGVGFMALCGLVFIFFGAQLASLYTDDQQVIQIAASLLVIAAFFQLSDGVQVVGLGALRGMHDVKVPTLITVLAYWVLGLPAGYILTFTFDFGPQGIWYGLLLGLSVAGVLLFYRFNSLSLSILAKNKANLDKASKEAAQFSS